jgi:DNA-directed RNA polymerase specialized sigma24 family protein
MVMTRVATESIETPIVKTLEQFNARFKAICRRKGICEPDVQDEIRQEVAIRAISSYRELEIRNWPGFLASLTFHACFDYRRKESTWQARRRPLVMAEHLASPASDSNGLGNRDDLDSVIARLRETLSPGYQCLFDLLMEGCSAGEAAARLGISRWAYYWRVRRLRQNLQALRGGLYC